MGRKKKQPDAADQGPNRSPSRTLFARITPELGQALDAYLASLRPEPTVTAVLEVALEDFLKGKGFWPLPSDKREG